MPNMDSPYYLPPGRDEGYFIPGMGRIRDKITELQGQGPSKIEQLAREATWERTYGAWAERRESPGLKAWWGKFAQQRERFWRDIDPSTFREVPLIKGAGDWARTHGFLEGVGGIQDWTKARGFLEDVGVIRRGVKFYGYDVKTGAIGEEISRGLIPSKIAEWETSKYLDLGGRKQGDYLRMFEPYRDARRLGQGDIYFGRPTPTGSKIIQTQAAGLIEAEEVLGQRKYLRRVLPSGELGGVIPLGTRAITGRKIPLTAIEEGFAGLKPEKALRELRKWYKNLARGTADETMAAGATELENILTDIVGEEQRAKILSNRKITSFNIRRLKEIQKIVSEEGVTAGLLGRDVGALEARGYKAVRKLVEHQEVGSMLSGRKLRGGGREWYKVLELDNLENASIMVGGRKVTTVGQRLAEFLPERASAVAPDMFEVALSRQPYLVPGKEDILATQILTPSGQQIGSIAARYDKAGKLLSPELQYTYRLDKEAAKGLLRTKMFARIEPFYSKDVRGYMFGLGLYPTKASARKQLYDLGKMWRARGVIKIEGAQSVLGEIFAGRGAKYLERADLESMLPRKTWLDMRTMGPGAGVIDVGKITGKGLSKNALIATTALITAGALLLWGATKSRTKKPLDERDIPASMYGDIPSRLQYDTGLPTYQPTARIIQNDRPGAYSTNISMEAVDGNNIADYRGIANSMSNMSRNALGVESAKLDLSVVDDSSSMNPHQMQRRFSEYLNR